MKKAVLLEGNWFQCRDVLEKIKDHLQEYELFSFDEQYSYDYVQQTIEEFPCFDTRRLIILNEFPHIKNTERSKARTKILNNLKKILPTSPAGTIVVLNNLNISAKSFISEIEKIGSVYIFDKILRSGKATTWVVDYFKQRGKTISFDDASYLVESLNVQGGDINLDKLYLLIKKMENYIGSKSKISEKDVFTIGSQSKDFVVWTLYNRLDEKDLRGSLSLFNDLLSFSKNPQAEIIQLINSFQWRYGLLYLAKDGLSRGLSKEDICSHILKLNKLERKGRGKKVSMSLMLKGNSPVPIYSEKMVNSIFNDGYKGKSSLSCYSLNELLLINYVIKETLTKIRAGCLSNEMMIPVEIIFMTICGKITSWDKLEILTSRNLFTLEDYYYYG